MNGVPKTGDSNGKVGETMVRSNLYMNDITDELHLECCECLWNVPLGPYPTVEDVVTNWNLHIKDVNNHGVESPPKESN